jgi:hypothetical protein
MNSIARISGALDHTAEVLKRTAEVLLYATAAFILVCVMALVAAGFYGVVHDGDDFGIDLGSGNGGGGDVIILPHLP